MPRNNWITADAVRREREGREGGSERRRRRRAIGEGKEDKEDKNEDWRKEERERYVLHTGEGSS